MPGYWEDKAVVVTGAARGQGHALVQLLAAAGAEVYALDRIPISDPAWTEPSGEWPGQVIRLAIDVSRAEGWDEVAGRLRASARRPCGLVNNAGITGGRATATTTEPADWDAVLATNLTGAYLGIRAVAPLLGRGGAILNVSSTVGMTGYFSAAYTASKWGLRGLSKAAAMELAPRGVRVNCICPGVVDTDLIRGNAVLYEALKGIIPAERLASAEELARAMLFLLGPEAEYITGADIVMDGGIMGAGLYTGVARAVGVLQPP